MKQKKWDELHKELDKALDSEFGSEEELKLDSVFENAKLALRKYISDNEEKVANDLNEMIKKSKIKTMKTEKKKAGRPRKEKEPVLTVYNPMERDLLNAERALIAKDESIVDLENRLDEAYREQEAILNELKINLSTITLHCNHVNHNAGSITKEDVNYCTSLFKRIMEHKFESKPENY